MASITRQLVLSLSVLALALPARAGPVPLNGLKGAQLSFSGVVQLDAPGTPRLATGAQAGVRRLEREEKFRERLQQIRASYGGMKAAAAAAGFDMPHPRVSSVTRDNDDASGFSGINAVDSERDNGFDLEPPDQALCVGNGSILEAVNDSIAVYRIDGRRLAGSISLNDFFRRDDSIQVSDPRCMYDSEAKRFFVTAITYPSDFFDPRNWLAIAVSDTSNAAGSYHVYILEVTNDGPAGSCPCFGDQPKIGADKNGFYISTDDFNGFGVAAQIYAFPKARLVAGSPVVVTFTIESTFDGAGPGFAVQPANPVPKGGNVNDTAFFVSSAFIDYFESRIDVWSLGGTSTLNTSHISLTLDDTPLDTQVFVYNGFVWASQKPGPTPILEQLSVDNQFASGMDQLDQGDFRMQQVVQSNGRLYSALGTAIGSSQEGGMVRNGVAWFQINVTGGSPSLENQGYITIGNNHLLYPSIAVNSSGKGAVVFTVTGADFFPSVGYAKLGSRKVHVVGAGAAPGDGFTGYQSFFNASRWGDYSAAATDEKGNIWGAAEFIPGPYAAFNNWGTFVAQIGSRDDN